MVKNKVAPPFRETEFDIMFDSGISYEGDLLDLAIREIVDKSGAWVSYGEVRLGQGRENAKQYLMEFPGVRDGMKDKILDAPGPESHVGKKVKAERRPRRRPGKPPMT